jgi:ankyrin repeat protein
VGLAFGAQNNDACRIADAVQKHDRPAALALLKERENNDVNAAQVDGMTALHWAAYLDDADIAEALIEAGANVKAVNRYEVTPLSLACANDNSAIVEVLLEGGADPNTTLRGGETALMTAARTGNAGAVNALLARGANVNAKERRGQTAIMWAAAEGNTDVVNILIRAGADFATALDSGFTPLPFRSPRRSNGNGPRIARRRRRREQRDAAAETISEGAAPGNESVDARGREWIF